MIYFLTLIDDADDRDFFEEIYEKYHKMMFDCALKILKNHHDAEDAVQQILLNLWRYIYNVKKVSEKKLTGYLYATTRNHCYDLIEKSKHIIVSYRQIIMDKAILHLNDEQAAAHIEIKVTYVRECLSRARATLHKLYLKKLEESEALAGSDKR